MSGGVVQLACLGAQDAHLSGKPEVSFFRANFKRHTHFAQSVERQLIQGTVNPGAMTSIRLERKGDLVSYMYLTAKDSTGLVTALDWSRTIDKVELYIGGQLIDTQDFTFNYLVQPVALADSFSKRFLGTTAGGSAVNNIFNTFYPFKFFFNTDFQNALPLIALQYHDVELRIYWAATASTSYTYEAWADFMFLDDMEREYFAKSSLDMLIWQVQRVVCPADYTAEIVLNHPVKFICANVQSYTSYTQQIKTQINGVDVGEYRGLPHWVEVPQYYHTPYGYYNPTSGGTPGTAAPLFIIPYCLDTSKLQPTGTLNFSRIDSYRILSLLGSGTQLTGSGATTIFGQNTAGKPTPYIYAVNYNIMRIQAGMAGLLYSN